MLSNQNPGSMCRIGEEGIDSSNALIATSAVSNAAGGKTRGGKLESIIPRNCVVVFFRLTALRMGFMVCT